MNLLDFGKLESGLDDLVGDGFLHQVDFALSDDLHEVVWNRNGQFVSFSLRRGWPVVDATQSSGSTALSELVVVFY